MPTSKSSSQSIKALAEYFSRTILGTLHLFNRLIVLSDFSAFHFTLKVTFPYDFDLQLAGTTQGLHSSKKPGSRHPHCKLSIWKRPTLLQVGGKPKGSSWRPEISTPMRFCPMDQSLASPPLVSISMTSAGTPARSTIHSGAASLGIQLTSRSSDWLFPMQLHTVENPENQNL